MPKVINIAEEAVKRSMTEGVVLNVCYNCDPKNGIRWSDFVFLCKRCGHFYYKGEDVTKSVAPSFWGIPESTKDVPTPEHVDRIVVQTGELPRFVKRVYTVFRDSGQRRYTLHIPWDDLLDLEMFRDPDKFPPRLKVPVVFDIPHNRLIIYFDEAEEDG